MDKPETQREDRNSARSVFGPDRIRHLSHGEETEIKLRPVDKWICRTPTALLRQPLPIDPGIGQSKSPGRGMVMKKALGWGSSRGRTRAGFQ